MRFRLTSKRFCDVVFVAAIVVVAAMAGSLNFGAIGQHPATFALLAAGVFMAETLPVKIPRRGEGEEITLSTSFSLALLLVAGLGPAIIAQSGASAFQDLLSRKPFWRVRFNIAQYAISMVAALLVLKLIGAGQFIGSDHPFTGAQLPAVVLCAAAFFMVNTGIVGTAVALYQGVSLRSYFRRDLTFVIATAGVLLLLAPIVVAAAAYSSSLIPLFAAPILAIHKALWEGARSQHAARHDALTSLPNRVAFREAVETVLQRDAAACVLLMDLDRFKDVNDTLGHHHGDLLLVQVADRLRSELASDVVVARLGGDEFGVLQPDCDRDRAIRLAERIVSFLQPALELEHIPVNVQASIGIARFPEDGQDVETLLQRADVAMYKAKETRADFALYDEGRDHHSPRKLALSADLRHALEQNELAVFYQPELDLESGQVTALEGLVRWPHPHLGLLLPGAFLEICEHTNLIKPLTQQVLEQSLSQANQWAALGLDLSVAVNVSAGVLIDHRFVDTVVHLLAETGTPSSRLKLEVTESSLMSQPQLAREILQELAMLGITIVIDDFGTGYSSLAYLAELPVSEVKIDRSFVSKMTPGSKTSIIVKATIDLAHHLELRAVAEGVEDRELLKHLSNIGCDIAQGYGIARPMPKDQVEDWLAEAAAAPLLGPPAVPLLGPGPVPLLDGNQEQVLA